MLLFFLLLSIVSELNAKRDVTYCSGLMFDHVYYDKEILLQGLGRPHNLVLHKFSNTLFFSHTIHNGADVDFEIICYDMKKKEYHRVQNIPGGYAIAYDQGNDDIYFGGHDGIYKYNFLTKSAEFFSEKGKSIWGLFIRKNFYYIEYPIQKLYVYVDENFVRVAEAVNIEVDNFFVSQPNDIYFANKTALYKIERDTKRIIILSDNLTIRQIVEDTFGDIYFCGNGIYVENKPFDNVKRVAQVDAFGMIFDGNEDVIYSDGNAIYRLVPSNSSAMCSESLNLSAKEILKDYLIK